MSHDDRNNKLDERIGRILSMAAGSAAPEGPCPSPEQIAALMEGGLKGPERDRVLSHVAGCDGCREVLATAVRLADTVPETRTPQRWSIARLVPYAAAAALVIAVASFALVYRNYSARSVPATGQVVARSDVEQPEPLQEAQAPSTDVRGTDGNAVPREKAAVPPLQDKAAGLAMSDMPVGSSDKYKRPSGSEQLQPVIPGKSEHELMGFSSVPPAERRLAEAPRTAAPAPAQPAAKAAPVCKPAAEGGPAVCILPDDKEKGAAQTSKDEPDIVKKRGTILSIDAVKHELVFVPQGTEEKITLRADAELIEGLRPGDTVKTVYERGAVNVARIISRQRPPVAAGC